MALLGVVKTYGIQKGFGFIISDEVDGDIYFQARDLPASFQSIDLRTFPLEGCTVGLQLHQTKDGKPQARQVELLSATSDDGSVTIFGEVKSFNVQKGFGFLSCSQLEGDVYFKNQEMPGQLRGQNVTGAPVAFQQNVMPDGKVQARHLQFLSMPSPAMQMHEQAAAFQMMMGKGKGGTVRAASLSPTVPTQQMPRTRQAFQPMLQGMWQQSMMGPEDGANLFGVVKSFEPTKGWGFINTPSVPVDIYFKCDQPLEQGQQVMFSLKIMPRDGKPQAWDVRPSLPSGDVVVGVIKSFSDKNSYGFIASEEVRQDIYFQRRDLPEQLQAASSDEVTGVWVRCAVKLHQRDGKPQAQDMELVSGPALGTKRPAGTESTGGLLAKRQRTGGGNGSGKGGGGRSLAGEQVAGYIKSYNQQKGFGFITSPGVDGDVYFKGTMLPTHLQSQTALEGFQALFVLNFTRDGKPQAADVQVQEV
mmetsp:Transcript_62016/g.202326  ORF Transcript_62016/g.202326 Transcript_62016/m.202326 type:complete len:474 (-) Transcript_62016:218-1639(-)